MNKPPSPYVSPGRERALASVLESVLATTRNAIVAPRIRSAIQLLATMLEPPEMLEEVIAPDPNRCPNCNAETDSTTLFCVGDLCSQEPALVRYTRRKIADGSINDLGVLQDGIGTRLLMVRSGGYPTRERTVSPALRAFIFERDKGLCTVCGAAGKEIDHLKTSNDPKFLRLTCKACNGNAMVANVGPIDDPERLAEVNAQLSKLAQRIAADLPFRACDDEVQWDKEWRGYKKLKKEKTKKNKKAEVMREILREVQEEPNRHSRIEMHGLIDAYTKKGEYQFIYDHIINAAYATFRGIYDLEFICKTIFKKVATQDDHKTCVSMCLVRGKKVCTGLHHFIDKFEGSGFEVFYANLTEVLVEEIRDEIDADRWNGDDDAASRVLNKLERDGLDALYDYVWEECFGGEDPYITGSADGDAYLLHTMSKDD